MSRRFSPAAAVFLALAVLPLAAGLGWASLYSLGLVGGLSAGFTLENWRHTLSDGTFGASLGLSAAVAAVVVGLSAGLAMGLFLALKNEISGPKTRFWLHLPLVLPPMVLAFLGFQWLSGSGMATRFLMKIGLVAGIESAPELIHDRMHFGVVAVLVFGLFPLFLLLFSTFYASENLENLSQLARTLGASRGQVGRRVVVPVLLRRAFPNLVLAFIVAFGAFEVPFLLGRQSPQMVSVFIAQKFKRFNLLELPEAYVAAVVYAVVVCALALFFLKPRTQTAPIA
ncbi:MAG: ABC transporter permease subunit [Saprospiraceae bacterium]